ncbi:hypothetical protein [Aromatoleum sp.]|uniref:hypothetical protein n=1 Tax=Aromatoleum sp. TaxID=2307007 RepID=UPI002FC852F4
MSEAVHRMRNACEKQTARFASLSNRVLRGFGLQLVRVRSAPADAPLPPLEDHPVAALLASRVGRKVAFPCPVGSIVTLNGLRFGGLGWHPFSAALRSYASNGRVAAEAALARFYSFWQPADAACAIAGFHERPRALRSAPAHAYHFSPWSDKTLQQELAQIERYYRADYVEHGCASLQLDIDGFKHHGPVSAQLARIELERLLHIYDCLAAQGYDRRHGHVHVYLLRRGGELRFICRGGLHRVAAADALGHECVPATLCAPYVVEADESEHWPQVANGCWDGEGARRYFHHLFDFDAPGWASALGIVGEPGESPRESQAATGMAMERDAPGAGVLGADADAAAGQ